MFNDTYEGEPVLTPSPTIAISPTESIMEDVSL